GLPGLVLPVWGAWRCEQRGPCVPSVLHATPHHCPSSPGSALFAVMGYGCWRGSLGWFALGI
ncbi:MAG: hypothetical protein AB1404_11800, partial [Spirochaetota bacterium]